MSSLCCCFSSDPIDSSILDESDPRYKFYVQNRELFQVSLDQAPGAQPACCCISCVCIPCAIFTMRKRVLEHLNYSVETHYACCQDYFWNPCKPCCTPLERDAPYCALCLEVCCCPGISMSATRFVMMDSYNLGVHPVDNQIIRFNNCIQLLACLCDVLAIFIRPMQNMARCVHCIADLVFCATASCMVSQVQHEIEYRAKEPLLSGERTTQGGSIPVTTATPVYDAQPKGTDEAPPGPI